MMLLKPFFSSLTLFAVLFVSFIFIANSSLAMANCAEPNLLEKVDAIRGPAESFQFQVKITDPNGSNATLSVRIKGQAKNLIRYIAPPRSKGRTLLFVNDNMWVYIPGSRQVLRISPGQRILGGAASADIARIAFGLDYQVIDTEALPDNLGERRCLLRLERYSDAAIYDTIELIIAGEEARPIEAVFFASSGKRKLKTAYYEGYQSLFEQNRPTILRIVEHLNDDEETIVEYSNYQLTATPDAWFNPAYLKRLK